MVNSINPNIDPSANLEQQQMRDPSSVKGSFTASMDTAAAKSQEKSSPLAAFQTPPKVTDKIEAKTEEIEKAIEELSENGDMNANPILGKTLEKNIEDQRGA